MKLLDLIEILKKQNDLTKILIFNDLNFSKNDIIELSQYFQDLYISFYNNFALRNLHVQLRNYKNIHVVQPNSIPNINYDIICSSELTQPIFFILSRIKYIKYFYCTNSEIELDIEIPGFKKDGSIKNLYIKDSLTVLINEGNKSFEANLNQVNSNEINTINGTNNLFRQNNEILNASKNSILIKNIVSSLNKFSNFKEVSMINDGELDICCFLSNKKDFDLFLKIIDYMNKNYSYVKYFIFLNGKTILKYFNEDEFKDLDYILIKSKDINDFKNSYLTIFEMLANGSYKFYMDEIDFNTEMIDLL